MELGLEHVLPYVPYWVKAIDTRTKEQRTVTLLHFTYDLKTVGHNHLIYDGMLISEHKMILKSLDHYKDIVSDAMSDLNCDLSTQMNLCELANRKIGLTSLSYTDALYCFSEHIDIFRLIDKGLAIDFYTL